MTNPDTACRTARSTAKHCRVVLGRLADGVRLLDAKGHYHAPYGWIMDRVYHTGAYMDELQAAAHELADSNDSTAAATLTQRAERIRSQVDEYAEELPGKLAAV